MQTPYQSSYAKWAPHFAELHKDKSYVAVQFAKGDIIATLALHSATPESEYNGKLYAELDALRDRERALLKERA